MSGQRLREAAALMRSRADCYHEGRWYITPGPAGHKEIRNEYRDDDGDWQDGFVLDIDTTSTAEHIASWHPAVALAVADWIDAEVKACGGTDAGLNRRHGVNSPLMRLANIYLGES